ncbi:MAG: hypothetical protein QXU81_10325 [Candidatus Bathyarchaeia archaeon]
MPFKVRAKLVSFLGDEEKYPCHFGYRIGDEIIFDGEKFIGRICPWILPALATKVLAVFRAGPRLKEPLPVFAYASISIKDPSRKIYDGIGFKPVLKSQEPFPGVPPEFFQWPPPRERIVKKPSVVCGDTRTLAYFELEAIDLADAGDSVTYFRRQMSILNKVLKKPGIELDKIIDEFTDFEKYEIYPPLSPVLIRELVEELELLHYVEVKDGKVHVTEKGKEKLEIFKRSLSKDEILALNL